jgi:DnaJ-class molecular chaperone
MTDPEDDEDYICPECNGSGESLFGPPGTGRCRVCHGKGELRDYREDEDR